MIEPIIAKYFCITNVFTNSINALKLSKKKGTNKMTEVLVGLSKAIKPRLANVRKTNLLDLVWMSLVTT